MDNLFTTESNIESNIELNDDYMNSLRKWERVMKINNLKRNNQTNNGPDYINDLKLWNDNIKINNFIKNKNTNNPPEYVKDLQLRNHFLENELDKMNSNFSGLSIV